MKITDIQLTSSHMADMLADELKIQHTTSKNLGMINNFHPYKIAMAGSKDKSNFFFYQNNIHDNDFISVNCPVGGIGDCIRFNDKYMVRIKNIRVLRIREWGNALDEALVYHESPAGFCGYDYQDQTLNTMTTPSKSLCSLLQSQGENVDLNSWVWVIDFEYCENLDVWLTNPQNELLAESLKSHFDELDVAIVSNEEFIKKFNSEDTYMLGDRHDAQRCIDKLKAKQIQLKALFEQLFGCDMHQPVEVNEFDDMPF